MRRLLVPILLLAAACRPDEPVRRYSAPKDPVWRMLAAVVPAGGSTYFLKAVGLKPRLEAETASLRAFVGTLRFDDGALKWTLPSGWEEAAGQGDRIATLRFGVGTPRLELSITRLDGDAGGLLANVNRWREQLGRGAIGPAQLPGLTTTIDAGALKATWVDLDGPLRPPASMGGGRAMQAKPTPEEGSPEHIRGMFAFDLPEGWVEIPQRSRETIFELRTPASSRVTLTLLGGDAGGLVANLNRWREQSGLEPVDEDRAGRLVRIFTLLGHPGHYAEVSGRERSIHAVFSLGPPFSMFLKLDGTPEAVNAEKSAFETFARSLRMNR